MVLRDGQHVISEYAYGQFNIYAWNTASDYNRNHKPDLDRNHLLDSADQAALQGRASYGSGTTTDEPYFDSNQDGRLDAQDYSPGIRKRRY